MKKLISVILALAICLSLTACGPTKEETAYYEAGVLMENKDWEGAAVLYESIPEYYDALDKALECRYQLAMRAYDAKAYEKAAGLFDALGDYSDAAVYAEKSLHRVGMMENADFTFIAAMEERIEERNNQSEIEIGSYEFFVEELEAIEKFENETFFDERLGELAKMYIDGVHLYESHLSVYDNNKRQERTLEGFYLMYSALVELYYDYEFMNDSPVYKKIYLAEQEDFLKMYDGAIAVREDIKTQFEEIGLMDLVNETEKNGEFRITITNNTQYTYSGWIYFKLRDAMDICLEQSDLFDILALVPGASQEFVVPMDEPERFLTFE